MQVIPALDILDGQAVRLLRGDYDKVTVYDPTPVAVATKWMRAGAALVHVVDLDAARGRSVGVVDAIRSMSDAGVRCQVGGGVRTPDDARSMIDSGASRVVVGSAFVDADGEGENIARAIDPERVVAAVDVRDGLASGHGWGSGGSPYADVVNRALDAGVRTMLVTGIAVDGTMDGPDFELLQSVFDLDKSIQLIASGGVGALEDLTMLARGPAEAVIVGRALYENRFTLGMAIEAASPGEQQNRRP